MTDRDEKQAAEEARQKAAVEAKAEAARLEARERLGEIREQIEARKAEITAAAAAAAAPRTYTVRPGDSLSTIAKELLGDANRWPEIFELNRDQIKDANLIYLGQELRLPK